MPLFDAFDVHMLAPHAAGLRSTYLMSFWCDVKFFPQDEPLFDNRHFCKNRKDECVAFIARFRRISYRDVSFKPFDVVGAFEKRLINGPLLMLHAFAKADAGFDEALADVDFFLHYRNHVVVWVAAHH